MTITLLIACATLLAVDDGPSRSTVLGLLEASHSPVKDVSFEYEGKMIFPQGGVSEVHDIDGLFDDYSGVIAARQDGAVLVDIYHRFYKRSPEIVRETIAILGERCELYTRTVDQRGATGEVVTAHYPRARVSGSMLRVSLTNGLVDLLRDDKWNVTQDQAEEVSGHKCIVVK